MREAHGLELRFGGQVTRLKWHRLRRSLSDPLFSAKAMGDGLAVGASMEVDLRVRADHGFVVLHDDRLEGETTGHGLIRDVDPALIYHVTMRNGGHRPILSEELAGLLQAAHPEALLQLDMKDSHDVIGERGVAHLKEHLWDAGPSVIISGADLDLIKALKEHVPAALRGIDPTRRLVDVYRRQGLKAVEAELNADLGGPTEPDTVYLAWQLILRAARDGLDLVALAHDLGKRVDAWTFNPQSPHLGFTAGEATDFLTLMELHPDQITTDEAPAIERAWLALQDS